jgi:hypothetical protein
MELKFEKVMLKRGILQPRKLLQPAGHLPKIRKQKINKFFGRYILAAGG